MRLLLTPSTRFEYRYRALLLFVSQPVLAAAVALWRQTSDPWYAIQVPMQLAWPAAVMAVLGTWIRVQASSYFTSVKVAQPDAMTDEIVDTGPFGSVRNPLYLGSLLEFFGYAVCFGWVPAFVYVLFHLLRYQRVVLHEEELFGKAFGTQFVTYCQVVPRWIPRSPWKLFYGSRWTMDAVFGNGPFIGLAAGVIVSAMTGTLWPVVPLEAAGFLMAGLHFLFRSQAHASAETVCATEDRERQSDGSGVTNGLAASSQSYAGRG
ncbi:MAG: isoprenylcysteine carboxylmethyltransferase family protein [Planctomycetaceae bacterium]|nr:isoprenylcysteine carboxylmethyltransferase family protein [Planctomycetaceae bacterium]